MTHKNFTRKDALRQEIPLPHKPTDEAFKKARLTVCANATDAADAEHLLNMLGLI